MRTLISAIFFILREEGSCKATCPECSERCIMGVHSTGGHGCGNGHSWGGK